MTDVLNTRLKYRLRIGEIIEAVIGADTIKSLFEAAEQGNTDASVRIKEASVSGQAPSGLLAVQLGVINTETKNALLTAQAAERTLQSIEALETFYNDDVPVLTDMLQIPHSSNLHPSLKIAAENYYRNHVLIPNIKDPSFKFIGSQGDPDMLVKAQATHQLMTEYENNEKIGMKDRLLNPILKIGNYKPVGLGYVQGFKAVVVESFQDAASALQPFYAEASANLYDVSWSIAFDKAKAVRHTPLAFAEHAIWLQDKLAKKENNVYLNNRVRQMQVDPVWNEMMRKRAQQAILKVA